MNSEAGGVLYVGINDDSVVYGFKLSQHEFDKFLCSIDREAKYAMCPPIMPQKYAIRRIPVYQHHRGRELWVVEVLVKPSPQDRAQGILHYYNRECYMRMNASTHKMEALDLMEYLRLNQPVPTPKKATTLLQEATECLEKEQFEKGELEELKMLV